MLDTRTRDLLKDLRGWSVDEESHELLFSREGWQSEAAELTFPELATTCLTISLSELSCRSSHNSTAA